jgi:anaerobic selenocysteine-containing dehydrogenase
MGQEGEKVFKTICQGCHMSCGILAQVVNGKITRVDGDPEHAFSALTGD